MLQAQAFVANGVLDEAEVRQTLLEGLEGRFRGQRVLVLIPDGTRTLPLPQLFRLLGEALHDARRVDFMVALGTHSPLSEAELCRLVGITRAEQAGIYREVGLLNHAWDNPKALVTIGCVAQEQVRDLAGASWHPSLGGDVPVRINRAALECDHILILGPTFPHEVVGFSGGAKYLFPGISGPEMINATHWMSALITNLRTIGVEATPVRAMIHLAADFVPTPVTLVALVVVDAGLAGVFIGPHPEAHHAAATLSAARHIVWLNRPFRKVLSQAPPMYGELWTGAKAMYKLEPGVAAGGEIIVYAPHLRTVSTVHGRSIYRIGYHMRDYFLAQWERFSEIPRGVLAHSTHLKGAGTFEGGREIPRIQVTLATQVPPDECQALNLGYQDPAGIRVEDWQNREEEGILFVPKAGEYLYRLKGGGETR